MLRNKAYIYGEEHSNLVPEYLQFGKLLLHKFWTYKGRVAIINAETDERLTYGEAAQKIVDIALSLARMGVKKGDVVSICSEKRMDFIPTLIGIICTGATFAPSDITCGRATMLHRVNLAKPKVMFCSPKAYDTQMDTLKTVDSIETFILYGDEKREGATLFGDFLTEHAPVEQFLAAPVQGWVDRAVILYSSGTTGLPKGIPLTHLNMILFTENSAEKSYYDGKKVLNTREWYYTYGMVYSLSCLHHGATVIYSPRNQPDDFLEAIQKYKIEIMQLAPATIVELVKSSLLEQYDVSSLQRMLSASTPLDAELVKTVHKKFSGLREVCQVYGMSEVGCLCSDQQKTTKGPKAGSVGLPMPGFIIKVVDLTSRVPLGPHQRGEICVQSPSLTPGYLYDTTFAHMDEEGFFMTGDVGYYDEEGFFMTGDVGYYDEDGYFFMTGDVGYYDEDGYFFMTGDVGYYDEDGYFFIVDRIKELIKFNSFQVAPAELEAVLQQHPAVREAGVVGAPHERFLEVPTAFVALQPGAQTTPEELVAYVDTQVSPRMRLEGGVRLVAELPRGAGAKLDRKALKLML